MFIQAFLFQWQPGVASEMKELAAREILALQGQIPGLLESSYGANVSPRGQGFTHGGVMKFKDKAFTGGIHAAPGPSEIGGMADAAAETRSGTRL
jgi:hypothetical protein